VNLLYKMNGCRTIGSKRVVRVKKLSSMKLADHNGSESGLETTDNISTSISQCKGVFSVQSLRIHKWVYIGLTAQGFPIKNPPALGQLDM
jgi:hypothetical protein